MLTMGACFPVYGADAVRERGRELWDGIKTEVSDIYLPFHRMSAYDPSRSCTLQTPR